MTYARTAELVAARAARPIDEIECRIAFGISLATIERVEGGEIVPDDELAARIDRFIATSGGGTPFSAAPGCPGARLGGLTGGGAATSPKLASPPFSVFVGAPIHANRGARDDGRPIHANRGQQ